MERKEIEKEIRHELWGRMPQIKVALKRLPNEYVNVEVLHFKGKVYIYDAFANKYYSMRQYGKKWALTQGELK